MIVNLPTGVDGGSIVACVACFLGSKKRPPRRREPLLSPPPCEGGLSAGLPCEGAACECGLVGCKVLERCAAIGLADQKVPQARW